MKRKSSSKERGFIGTIGEIKSKNKEEIRERQKTGKGPSAANAFKYNC